MVRKRFDAQLDQIGDHKLEKHEIKDRETAERIVAEIENAAGGQGG